MKKQEQPEALKTALANLRKQYGDGVVMDTDEKATNVEVISTNCFTLDFILGCGGLPRGRVIEIYGQESSGKTTLSLFIASQIQKQGGTVAFLDVENAFDKRYSDAIGVNTDKMLVSQPGTLEETFDIIRAYAATNAVDLCIIDSVAAMTPKSELEGEEMLKDTMAVQARLLGKGLRILTGPIARSKMTVIFINQLRDKIGIFYGEKTVTPGGKALKFYSSVRLSVAKGDKIKGKNDEQIGNVLKITAVKNKVAPPFRSGEITLYYGSGIDMASDTFDAGVADGIIEKSGNTYSFGDKKIGVGKDQSVDLLKKDTEMYETIRAAIKEKLTKK